MDPKTDEERQYLAEISSGELIVSGPSEENGVKEARVAAGEGVLLRVNGKEIKGGCKVGPRDRVELVPLHLQEPARVEVKISPDKMTAQAIYFAPLEISYTIPDHLPVPELIINAIKKEERVADLSTEEIKNILERHGVTCGLDGAALSGLISEPGNWQVVAVGRPPVQGRDGYVQPLFQEGLQLVNHDLAEARIDYRKRFEIPQVEKEQVIARIHPPRPGEPGLTVTGAAVPPRPVHPAEVRCETGAALDGARAVVVAQNSGVPVCRRRGKQVSVQVDNIYYHRGDIDIKSGHIDFEGHLKIEGAVNEGSQVKAEGDIEVGSNSSGAKITAGGSIIFKRSCIKCLVRAGARALQGKEFSRLCSDLTEGIDLALNMGRGLAEELQKRGLLTEVQLNAVLRSLIQKKIPDLAELSEAALLLSGELSPAPSEPLKDALQDCHLYLQQGGGLLTLARLEQLYQGLLRNQEGWLAVDPGETMAIISVYYVQNSSLFCPGDIFVDGPGAYNSHFDCGGEVHINRVFRGGSIKAGGDIYIGEAGIPRLTKMQGLIETGGRNRIYLGRVHESTRIKIGKQKFYLEEDLSNVQIYRDQQGDIAVAPWEERSIR